MGRNRTWSRAIAASAAALTLVAGVCAVRGDVTINEKTKFDGPGGMALLAGEGATSTVISADRARREVSGKATAGILRKPGSDEGHKRASITRLDKRLMYEVNYNSKSYYEITFDQMKKDLDALSEAIEGSGGRKTAAQDPAITCGPLNLETKKTGQSETINGFSCQESRITGKTTCENSQSKQTCNVVFTSNLWITPMTPELKEAASFHRRQAEAMGMDSDQSQALLSGIRALVPGATMGIEAVMGEIRRVDGYPVRRTLKIEKQGDCGAGDAQASERNAPREAGAGLKAQLHQKRAGAQSQGDEKEGAMAKVFSMTTEVTSVTTGKAADDAFEPPSEFQKKAPPRRAGQR